MCGVSLAAWLKGHTWEGGQGEKSQVGITPAAQG